MALKTPEGVCAKMLEFISFEKDEEKDWDEFRNLFLPTAHLMSFRFQPGESISKQARNPKDIQGPVLKNTPSDWM